MNSHIEDGFPKLLNDSPEVTNLFPSHESVTAALVEVITSEPRGKCIALEGSWGSGKSTIIDAMSKSLRDGKIGEVFVFDTWSNQGDPLRFSFMEKLNNRLLEILRDDRTELDNIKSGLDEHARGSSVEEEKHSGFALTGLPIFFLLSLVTLLPLGTALIATNWSSLSTLPAGEFTWSPWLVVGLVLALLPILILGWSWISKLPTEDGGRLRSFEQFVAVLNAALSSTKTIRVRQRPLATQLEFERTVHKLLSLFSEKRPNQRFIVVFDNIDRVSHQESPRVWSLINTVIDIVQSKVIGSNHLSERVWLVVPVDTNTITVPMALGDGENAETFRHEFVEKTFQITLNAAPQLPSHWEQFFYSSIAESFGPSLQPSDKRLIASLFFRHRANSSDSPPTPRQIKRFINDLAIGYIARRALDPEQLPSLPLLTIFICKRGEIRKDGRVIPEKHLPDSIRRSLPDMEPLAALAAVFYGVKITEGLEVLLHSEMKVAIETADYGPIKRLERASGLGSAIQNYLLDQQNYLKAPAVDNLAVLLHLCDSLPQQIAKEIRPDLSREADDLIDHATWTGNFSAAIGSGLAHVLHLASTSTTDLDEKIDRAVNAAFAFPEQDSDTELDDATRWIAQLKSLKHTMDRLNLQKELEIRFNPGLPTTARHLLYLADSPLSSGHVLVTFPMDLNESLTTDYRREFETGDLSPRSIKELRHVSNALSDFRYPELLKAANARLKIAEKLPPDNVGFYIELLELLLSDPRLAEKSISVVQAILRNGWIFHHIATGNVVSDQIAFSILRLCHITGTPLEQSSIAQWNQAHGGVERIRNQLLRIAKNTESLTELASEIAERRGLAVMVHAARKAKLQLLTDALVSFGIQSENDEFDAEFIFDLCIPRNGSLSDEIRENLYILGVNHRQLVEYLTEESRIDTLPTEDLAFLAVEAPAAVKDKLGTAVYTNWKGKNVDWWKARFVEQDDSLAQLAEDFSQAGVRIDLGDDVFSAMRQAVSEAGTNHAALNLPLLRWAFKSLGDGSTTRAAQYVRDSAIGDGARNALTLMVTIGDPLIAALRSRQMIKSVLISGILPALLDGKIQGSEAFPLVHDHDLLSDLNDDDAATLKEALGAPPGDGG